jgi:hypothetical protein
MAIDNKNVTTSSAVVLTAGQYQSVVIYNASDTEILIGYFGDDLDSADGVPLGVGEKEIIVNQRGPYGLLFKNGITAKHAGTGNKVLRVQYMAV